MANSWIVIGPGRTGSLTIARSLYSFYNYDENKFVYFGPDDKPRLINKNFIVHTHNKKWLDFVNTNTEIIVSTRDPVDSALSWCIQPKLKQWHFYPWKTEDVDALKNLKISKFYLNPADLLNRYQNIMNWYNSLEIKNNYKILDYSKWCDNTSLILLLLGYKKIAPKNLLTIKNPYSYKDWVINHEEITDLCDSLNRNLHLN